MNKFNRGFIVVAVIVALVGLRFVTQAGQGISVIQNDGYAVVGGFMLFSSGMLIGRVIWEKRNDKTKV